MKVIIAGSRTITNEGVVREAILAAFREGIVVTEVVCGKARGVDSVGESLARKAGIPVREFPADWQRHGKAAGFLRNQQMAEYADALIAVTNGSPGTAHMIQIAKSRGLAVFVHRIRANYSA